MDYRINLTGFFEAKSWMLDKKLKKFLKSCKKGDLVMLIDDAIPNIAPLLTVFKNYNSSIPGEFIGKNPVYLCAPKVEYTGLKKIVTPRIKNPEGNQNIERRITYIPHRFYSEFEIIHALENEEGYNMKEFSLYEELIKKGSIKGISWNYQNHLLANIRS